jgi:hypothetical protein
MVTQTYVKSIVCPDCGAKVREVVSQGVFQVGGSSIGPPVLPCPRCGLFVESGLSEWEEKSILARAWYILRILLWTVFGTSAVGITVAFVAAEIAERNKWIRPAQHSACYWTVFGIVAGLLAWRLLGNSVREIRDSRARTATEDDPRFDEL